MQRKPIFSVWSMVLLLLVPIFTPFYEPLVMQAGAQTAGAPAPPTADELDQLLSPVALYPDSLLAQITTASTNPQEILDVNNWIAQNSNLSGNDLMDAAQKQGFDPAFVALVNFPTVLDMMAENIDDYAAIGDAVLANQAMVTASVQRLRSRAYASGALRSTEQQKVDVQQAAGSSVYTIAPVNPQTVYVPMYDPTVVYVQPVSGALYAPSVLSFGVGIGIGALWASTSPWGWNNWGWNWGGGGIYFGRTAWRGWGNPYRPSRPWFRPRPPIYAHRPGFGGNWGYRPPNYRPQRPINRPVYTRPGLRPGYNRPGAPGRPGGPGGPGNRPGPNPGRPNPGNRPGPTPGRPNPGGGAGNRPNPGNRPGPTPGGGGNRPGGPGGPPSGGNRPSPGPRPGGGGPPGGGNRPGGGGGGPRPGGGGGGGPRPGPR